MASLAANIPLAAFGGENRAETMPLVPIAAAKATIEAAVAGWYFYQMPTKEKAGAATVSLARWQILALPR